MKRSVLTFFFTVMLIFVTGEISGQDVIQSAVFNLGTDTICSGTEVVGTYQGLQMLSPEEYVKIRVLVSIPGKFSITTNLVNGYQFSASGHFPTPGPHIVNLLGSGVPVSGQIDQFIVSASDSGGSCTFHVIVLPWICGRQFTDMRDSQNYRTVLIDRQCWLAQNLNTGIQISSLRNQTNNGVVEKFCYNGNEGNCRLYGGLYQWGELMQYNSTPGIQGLCPEGWHVPTDQEWCSLITFLDPSVDCNLVGNSGKGCGGRLKEEETRHWASPNVGATNTSGFSALPTGFRDYPASFSNLPYEAYFWTSTECGESHSWNRGLHYYDDEVSRDDYLKSNGFAARCIKD